jgi:hypothetical protein
VPVYPVQSRRPTGIVDLGTTRHNEAMAQDHVWFSSTGRDDNSHLTDEQRQIVQERTRSRGELLGVVHVRVYENGCEPYVTFPEGAALGVDADQSVIAHALAPGSSTGDRADATARGTIGVGAS